MHCRSCSTPHFGAQKRPRFVNYNCFEGARKFPLDRIIFNEAIFLYTLAALKLKSVGVDDNDPKVREVATLCHSNITLARCNIETYTALAEATCSRRLVIQLIPACGETLLLPWSVSCKVRACETCHQRFQGCSTLLSRGRIR